MPSHALPYDEAAALLDALATPDGIVASLDTRANYGAVFARDGVMAGIAALLAGRDAAITAFARTLDGLRDRQGPRGQIASNYHAGPRPTVSFGTLAPRLDSVSWYVLGVAVAARAGAIDPAPHATAVRRALDLLDAIEYNGCGLLYVPAGGNWADEYVTEGYTLFDQTLRALALRLASRVYSERAWAEQSARIGDAVVANFWPEDARDPERPIASFTPLGTVDRFDAAGCALLALSGIAPERSERALAWIARTYLDAGALPPAFAPAIAEGDAEWASLRRYQLHGFRNATHEYHNGGVWPIWLGWLALAFARLGRPRDALRLAELLAARIAAAPDWVFAEYLHGVTGAPGGVRRMAYSAAGIVFAAHAADARTAALLGDE